MKPLYSSRSKYAQFPLFADWKRSTDALPAVLWRSTCDRRRLTHICCRSDNAVRHDYEDLDTISAVVFTLYVADELPTIWMSSSRQIFIPIVYKYIPAFHCRSSFLALAPKHNIHHGSTIAWCSAYVPCSTTVYSRLLQTTEIYIGTAVEEEEEETKERKRQKNMYSLGAIYMIVSYG